MSKDKVQITALGGPTKVAELLGYDKRGGVQRVQNWMARGIPSKVKLDHPELFPREGAGVQDVANSTFLVGRQGRQPPSPTNIFDTVPEHSVVGVDPRSQV